MSSKTLSRLYDSIRDVQDFPEPGIVFKDITPLLLSPELLELAIECLADPVRDLDIDRVLGIESRGFIFGAPLAMRIGAGLVLARKAGKLPWKTRRVEYALEYGTDVIEVHTFSWPGSGRILAGACGGRSFGHRRDCTSGGASRFRCRSRIGRVQLPCRTGFFERTREATRFTRL